LQISQSWSLPIGLEVLLDILFAPDGSMLTAEDRGRETGTRSDVLQECSWGDTGEIGRLDRRDGRLAAFDHPADGRRAQAGTPPPTCRADVSAS